MKLTDLELEAIQTVVAKYHYRDAVKHNDGSFGTIAISPRQLTIILARMYKRGKKVKVE